MPSLASSLLSLSLGIGLSGLPHASAAAKGCAFSGSGLSKPANHPPSAQTLESARRLATTARLLQEGNPSNVIDYNINPITSNTGVAPLLPIRDDGVGEPGLSLNVSHFSSYKEELSGLLESGEEMCIWVLHPLPYPPKGVLTENREGTLSCETETCEWEAPDVSQSIEAMSVANKAMQDVRLIINGGQGSFVGAMCTSGFLVWNSICDWDPTDSKSCHQTMDGGEYFRPSTPWTHASYIIKTTKATVDTEAIQAFREGEDAHKPAINSDLASQFYWGRFGETMTAKVFKCADIPERFKTSTSCDFVSKSGNEQHFDDGLRFWKQYSGVDTSALQSSSATASRSMSRTHSRSKTSSRTASRSLSASRTRSPPKTQTRTASKALSSSKTSTRTRSRSASKSK